MMMTRALLPALLLALGFGMPADTGAAGGPDRFISQDEFSVLFEPDPEETMKKRGLAKVPRPGFDAKKREATTYVLFETGAILLKSPESFQQLDAAGKAFKKAMEGLLAALKQDIPALYAGENFQRRKEQLLSQARRREQRLMAQFEQRLAPHFGLLWHDADRTLVPELAPMLAGGLTLIGLYVTGFVLPGYDPLIGQVTKFRPYFLLGLDPIVWGLGASLVAGVVVITTARPGAQRRGREPSAAPGRDRFRSPLTIFAARNVCRSIFSSSAVLGSVRSAPSSSICV